MGYKFKTMRNLFYLLIIIGSFINSTAQTGIGTSTPVNKLQVEATTADPATSGTSANGNLRLSGTTGSHVLDFGLSSSSTFSWLQSRSRSNYGTNFNMLFNPNGGQVGIGTFAPLTTLTVGNAAGTIPGEITLNPTGATNEGGQISIKRSLSGGTVDWTIDHYGTSTANARLRFFSGSNEANGINILENGNIGLGTSSPTAKLNLVGGGIRMATGFNNSATRPALNSTSIGSYEIRGVGSGGSGTTQTDGSDDGFLRLSAGGGGSVGAQSSIDLSGFSNVGDMNNTIVMRTTGTERLRIDTNGNIGIGTANPVDRLDIRNAMSVNEIKFRGTDGGDDSDPYRLRKLKIGTLNELQLHLNDDPDERFAIYGNSCLTAGCPEYSTHLFHYFRSDGNVYHAGNVGIGTTSPLAPLHVASSAVQYINMYGYLSQSGTGASYTANTNISYSIQADQRIRASEFNAISDSRIKKDIVPLHTTKQLSDLNKLKVINYSYIDQIVNGNKQKTGFIAQEVEKVNPQFVNQSTDFIPSVYAIAKTTLSDQEGLHITTATPHGFEKGDVVKFFTEGKNEMIKTIDEVKSPNEFLVKEWEAPITNLFVYGKKVADFRAVDFDQITALSVAAIQELSKQIEKLQHENAALNKVINKRILEKQSELEKRVLQLESKFNKKKR
jgi:hypothetical protein